MADEQCSKTQNKDLVDFPPGNLLNGLILSFPKEWRGIFAALNAEHLSIQAATLWLQKKSSHTSESLSDIPPNWNDFIDHLASDFPVVLNDKLFFRPKILLLPLNMQRNTLAFISHHFCFLPMETLDKLVQSLVKFSTELEGWRATYVKILESKLNEFKHANSKRLDAMGENNNCENNMLYTDVMTKESKSRFEDLVKKSQIPESSRNVSWLSQFLDSERRDNDGNISEKRPPPHKNIDVVDQTDIDMIDLTAEEVDLQSKTTLQEIQPGSSHDFDDSDIEIIEVTECTASKQMKAEEGTDVSVTADFTVPPPPEQLIIETEDVPEHLITEEATAESNLSDALQLKVSALLNLLTGPEVKEDSFTNEMDIFSCCSSLEMEHICNRLNLKTLQESLVICLCMQFIALPAEPSFGNAAIFATHCLLPKVQELKQGASRALFNAVSLFAKKHSRAFCHGVILRLAQQSNFDTPQVDLINKVVKECFSEETRIHLLELIFDTKLDCQGGPFLWSENIVSVVQTVVDTKPECSSNLFGSFAGVIERQSQHLSKSLKFAKMLLAVIKTYGQHVCTHFQTFVRILEGNDTFLKKAGLSALQKASKG